MVALVRKPGKAHFMDTFLPNKIWGLLFLCVAASSCTSAAGCEYMESHIQVAEWKAPLPKSVSLQVISKSSADATPKSIEVIPYSASIAPPIPAYGWGPTLSLKQSNEKVRRLRVEDEYILLIEDKPVYKISNIESKRPELGCPVTSFKVNDCIGEQGRYLRFDASCR